ncbi:MAG: helical backbone metal receptor, partial [Lentisphaeria bacterium]
MRLFILFLTLFFAACSPEINRVQRPKRIITLAPSVTEIVCFLGENQHLVAVSSYCDFPKYIESLPRVGGLYDTSIETIMALKPDLVIALSSQSSTANALNSFGIETLLLDNSSLREIDQSIIQVATRLNIADKANLVKDLHQEIKINNASQPRVLIVTSRLLNSRDFSTIYVAGKRTWYNDILEKCHAKNAYEGKINYSQISPEGLISINPDIIIEMIPKSANKN